MNLDVDDESVKVHIVLNMLVDSTMILARIKYTCEIGWDVWLRCYMWFRINGNSVMSELDKSLFWYIYYMVCRFSIWINIFVFG